MLHRRRRALALLAVTAAPALTIALTGAAVAQDDGTVRPAGSASRAPTLGDRTIDATERAAATYDRPGFAGVQVDPDAHVVTLRWAGTVPADVARLAGKRAGVTTKVSAAAYSEKELVRAATELVTNDRKARGSDASITMAGPNHDRSGLDVYVTSSGSRQSPSALSESLSTSGIPVSLVDASDQVGPVDASRPNDSAPWQGGGAINRGGHHSCTTGFAVLTSSGSGRLLSAGHCEDVGDTVNDGQGQAIGEAVGERINYDSLLIDPTAPSGVEATIGKVFTGEWNSNTSRFVGGAAAPSVGEGSGAQQLCTSGANSGEHCDLEVTATGIVRSCDGGQGSCTGFLVNGPGLNAAQGDSGGPIYIVRSDGRVGARGLVNQLAYTSVTCSGVRYNPAGLQCSTGAYSVGIHQLLDVWNVRIET